MKLYGFDKIRGMADRVCLHTIKATIAMDEDGQIVSVICHGAIEFTDVDEINAAIVLGDQMVDDLKSEGKRPYDADYDEYL